MKVTSQKKFFRDIALDENGNIIVVIEDQAGTAEKGGSQYNTFKKLSITEEGYLKIKTD